MDVSLVYFLYTRVTTLSFSKYIELLIKKKIGKREREREREREIY
jgi:hypothetical protein